MFYFSKMFIFSKNVRFSQICSCFQILFRSFRKLFVFSIFGRLFQKMFPILRKIHIFKKCSLFKKLFTFWNFVLEFNKCSVFQILFEISKNVPVFKFVHRSKKCSCFWILFGVSKNMFPFRDYKFWSELEKCSRILKDVHDFYCLEFHEMFHFKVIVQKFKKCSLFQNFVQIIMLHMLKLLWFSRCSYRRSQDIVTSFIMSFF